MHAANHAVLNVVQQVMMCQARDLGTECDATFDARYRPERVLVYDNHPGRFLGGGAGWGECGEKEVGGLGGGVVSLECGGVLGLTGGCRGALRVCGGE